jgi:hypothetical protein
MLKSPIPCEKPAMTKTEAKPVSIRSGTAQFWTGASRIYRPAIVWFSSPNFLAAGVSATTAVRILESEFLEVIDHFTFAGKRDLPIMRCETLA